MFIFTGESLSSTMKPKDLILVFTFPDADLSIVVTSKGERIVGRVSSRALCSASCIFGKFIHPPFGRLQPARKDISLEYPRAEITQGVGSNYSMGFEEWNLETETSDIATNFSGYEIIEDEVMETHSSKPNEKSESELESDGELDFQDDNAESILVLLQIVHLQFNKIPTKLPFQTLLGLTHICEQYQCVQLVLPWLDSWLADGLQECREAGKEEYVFIAWSFGRATLFAECTNHIANEIYLVDGIPIIDQGYFRFLKDIIFPPHTIG